MPYLGNTPSTSFATVVKDSFSGDGSTVAFTLSKVATTNSVSVFVENVRQEPTTAYAVSGTTLTFTAAPVTSSGNNIYVLHMNPTTTTTHPAAQNLTAVNGTLTGTLAVTGASTLSGNTTLSGASNSTATHTMGTDNKLFFRDSAIFIQSSADGQLDIDADTEIELTTTTVDLNGALDVSGASTLTGDVTLGGDLTVDTNTLFVDASTNKVHINSTSADSDTAGLSCEFAAGGNYVAHFENTTNATPYTVAITEPGSPGTGYPLLWVGTSSSGYLRVDSGTGVVTESNKPIFMAKFLAFSSGASNTNPASNYQSPAINRGSHFNSSNGVFTAPTAGVYAFFGSLLSSNNSVVVRIYFEKNGSVDMGTQHEARTTEGFSGYSKQMCHAIISLAANDTVELVVYQDSSNTFYATNDSGYNSFSGYLIG